MVSFRNDVVVHRRVRRNEPKSDILLELVTWTVESVSVDIDQKNGNKRFILFTSFAIC